MSDGTLITTRVGTVKGRILANQPSGREAVAFLGIPYAEPPVGELRFQKTVPVKPWTGVKECTKFGAHSPYYSTWKDGRPGSSEDCLFLNVFAPIESGKPKKNLPVLFYIHGGGFIIDSSDLVGDERIGSQVCSRDVIVVTINYRLGIAGFAALSGQLKGNYGLWDMVEALKWTADNISAFGGDASRITVAGQSAGAVAADFLALSPHSRGLFQQLILFAGSADCLISTRPLATVEEKIIAWAESEFDFKKSDGNAKLTQILKQADIANLVPDSLMNPEIEKSIPLGPVWDDDFFPKPLEVLRSEAPAKKVVIGVTEHECLTFALMYKAAPSMRDSISRYITLVAPGRSLSPFLKLYDQFVDDSLPDDDLRKFKQFVKFLGILFFCLGHHKTTSDWLARGSDVFQFCFKFCKPGMDVTFGGNCPFDGASHCLELPYFLGCNLCGPYEPDEQDNEMTNVFAGYLCNFIATGDPNSTTLNGWQKADLQNVGRHFEFDRTSKMAETSLYGDDIEVWQKELGV